MPAVEASDQAKPVGEELLWQALKEHIMLERQKKKEGIPWFFLLSLIVRFSTFVICPAQNKQPKLKKSDYAKKRRLETVKMQWHWASRHSISLPLTFRRNIARIYFKLCYRFLGETREQIQLLNTRLEELRNEKQQLFLRLKKVLNEDENRKRQQQQKDRCVAMNVWGA